MKSVKSFFLILPLCLTAMAQANPPEIKPKGVFHRMGAFLSAYGCDFLLSDNSKKIHKLERNPKLLTAQHFVEQITKILPEGSFVTENVFLVDPKLQATEASRLKHDDEKAEKWEDIASRSTDILPPALSEYRWLYMRVQVFDGVIRIFNWKPEAKDFVGSDGHFHVSPFPPFGPEALAKMDIVDERINKILKGEKEPKPGQYALSDRGEVIELIVEDHPIHEYLNEDGTLIKSVLNKFKIDAALAQGQPLGYKEM